MKTIKLTLLLATLLCSGTFALAQNYDEFLNMVMEKLNANDCDAAQKFYNVYKELTGKSVSSVEVLIKDCKAASANGPKQIQINYQNYEVLPDDLEGKYNWEEAKSACANLTAFGKNDWYLPTMVELECLIKHDNEIGRFTHNWYWSSTGYDVNPSYARSFGGGDDHGINAKWNYGWVRCVRKY